MPFTIRPYRRLPVCCPVTYQVGLFEGYGAVWNLSLQAGGSLAICRYGSEKCVPSRSTNRVRGS